MRIKKIGWVGLLIAVLLSACSPQANAEPEMTETPQVAVEQPVATVVDEPAPESNCLYGTCVRGTIVAKDEDSLLVFFDLTDQNGIVILGEEKFIMGNLLVAGYLISENNSEEAVFQAELNNQQYFCYSGEDLPWNQGEPTATCGFSIPISELKVIPEIGDRMRVELPSFGSYSQEIVVQERAVLE